MLAEERFQAILSLLEQKRAATVTELAKETRTSESTIRRDLNTLDRQGRLNKVHGGATALESEFMALERDVITREYLNVEEKEEIAQYAAEQIRDDDFIFLDAGTTTMKMAEYVGATKAAFVTNGIVHARILSEKGLKVYIVGGQLKPSTEAIVGVGAVNSLRQYNFTKAFMGVTGIAVQQGFTAADPEEAQIKTEAMRRSRRTYMLADHSKFNKVYAATIETLERAWIITDRLPDETYKNYTVIKEVELEETE